MSREKMGAQLSTDPELVARRVTPGTDSREATALSR